MGKNQEGVILLPIVFVAISAVILGVVLYKNPKPTPKPQSDTNSIDKYQQPLPGNPSIENQDERIIFTDSINNYYLDLTSLPEISITEADVSTIYEFEMYKQQGEYKKSVARFGLSESMDNPNNLSLEEYAKSNYKYQLGTDNARQGWGELITTPLESTIVGNIYEAINWREENQGDTGFYFDKYLFNFKGKIVFVRMVAWQKDVFNENRLILKDILTTFKQIPDTDQTSQSAP